MTKRSSYCWLRISLNFEGMLTRPLESMVYSYLPLNIVSPPQWVSVPPFPTFCHLAIIDIMNILICQVKFYTYCNFFVYLRRPQYMLKTDPPCPIFSPPVFLGTYLSPLSCGWEWNPRLPKAQKNKPDAETSLTFISPKFRTWRVGSVLFVIPNLIRDLGFWLWISAPQGPLPCCAMPHALCATLFFV